MEESTGRLPPTPIDHMVARAINVMWFGEPPAAVAKAPTINSVMLKEIL
jgi:hypothetical protein